MQEARKLSIEKETAAKDTVSKKYTKLSDQEFSSKFAEHFKIIADSLRADNILGDYHTMMRIMDFFGLLVKKQYISFDDIDGLFRGSIIVVGEALVAHVKGVQNERDVPIGLYENALVLIAQVKAACPK